VRHRQRNKSGSVVLDKRINTWNFFWWENGKRHSKKIGTKSQYPTNEAAWRAAKPQRDALENQVSNSSPVPTVLTVNVLVEQYRAEKMPKRKDTRRSYEVWIRCYILPKWGEAPLSDVQARPVQLWLESLTLAPRSKSHIRGTLRNLWDFAMYCDPKLAQRNPMELVKVKGASKRMKKPRSLIVLEFQQFIGCLDEPFRTIAVLCVCLGLRISEALGLKWSDIDWLASKLKVERGIVNQTVDDVKTLGSEGEIDLDPVVLLVLKNWKQITQFSDAGDWLFASPAQLGRLPWSYDSVYRRYQKAAVKAGISGFGTHTLRHTFRSFHIKAGTPLDVQRMAMRHADSATTLQYGDVEREATKIANRNVARLALAAGETAGETQ
jgi:integrase